LNCSSYRDVFGSAFGKRAGNMVDALICTNSFFACCSYNILVTDFLQKALEGLFGLVAFPRPMIVWFNTLLITMPLSHARNLSPLQYTSMMGIVIVGFVIMYVVSDFVFQFPDAHVNLKENKFRVDLGLFTTLAICTGAFQAHYNSPKFFRELGCDLEAHKWVVKRSFLLAFAIYSAFAVSGMGLFGKDLMGNVLKNYPAEGNVPVLMCWLGMAFATVFTYPLVFTTGRDSFIGLCPAVQRAAKKHPTRTHVVCTSIPVALIATLACLVQDVSKITGLLGATVGASLCWIFPASVYLRVTSASASELHEAKVPLLPGRHSSVGPLVKGPSWMRTCAKGMVCVGFASMAVGLSRTFGLI